METQLQQERLVGDQAELEEVAARVGGAPTVAIDTEFVRESTYFPQLCLIQISTADFVTCVDCLADIDLEPLLEALLRPDCAWILHSARQDLEVLWMRARRRPARLQDTQIAASLLGHPPQISLQDLLERTLGVTLEKGHARTDWSRRPLPEAALRYAIDDVRYLPNAWRQLESALEARGRLQWLHEDCERLLSTPPDADTLTIFKRLRGVSQLNPAAQRAALCLVRWRERRAMQADRPRRWILSDDVLIGLARAQPRDAEALRRVSGLPRRLAARSGDDILAAIRESDAPAVIADVEAVQSSQLHDKSLLKALQRGTKRRAEQLGIHPEVLATRRDLAAIAAGETPEPLAFGWRARELEDIVGSVRPAK